MIISKPDVIPSGLYNQKQAAEALHLDRHTVARYEANGRLKFKTRKADNRKVTKTRKADNRKVTTGAEIIRCWQGMYLIK